MTTDYTIDISKNNNEFKRARTSLQIYMYGFLFVGCFYVLYTLIKGESWERYPIGLTAFFSSFIMYLRMNGKWIYARYVLITTVGIKWQKSNFVKEKLNWSEINQINFEFKSIAFHLTTKKITYFSLVNIIPQQIDELKELLSQISNEKGIKYIVT